MSRVLMSLMVFGSFSLAAYGEPAAGLTEAVETRVEAILDQAVETGDFYVAHAAAQDLFDQVLAQADGRQAEAFRRAAFAKRLTDQLDRADLENGAELLTYMRANTRLADALVFLIKPEDDPAAVFALLDRLRAAYGDQLNDCATLAAALCVVHDVELHRRINENTATADDPVHIFEYFRRHQKKMLFGVRNVPSALLVYVVDTTAPVPEMQWALSNFAGDRRIGAQFHQIRYDYAHYRTGAPKRVTEAGFSLPNIKKHGGVCADQAYFAVAVGKAIGVPTAYTVGRGGNVGHAWVGFFEARGKRGSWNFNVGRYASYRGVRGVLTDPQTRRQVNDSTVSLLGEMIGVNTDDLHTAVAMTDAAVRLATIISEGGALPAVPLAAEGSGSTPRPVTTEEALKLVEIGLHRHIGYAPGWQVIADMAEQGQLTLAQKRRWADLVIKLCGEKYPDFAVEILHPMIRTIEDVKNQNAVWEAAFKKFSRRKDLAAEIRMAQGEAWDQAGDPVRAGRCYHDVIVRYANDGPFVITALQRTEEMLIAAGKEARVPELYRGTWQATRAPQGMAPVFMKQSNWYKIGRMYAQQLRNVGAESASDKVEKQLTAVAGNPIRQ